MKLMKLYELYLETTLDAFSSNFVSLKKNFQRKSHFQDKDRS